MKSLLILLTFFLSCGTFGQPFKPDAFGYVSGEAFLNYCKKKQYSLVGLFDPLPNEKKGMSAQVVKNGQRIYIDLNGKEFTTHDELAKYYGFYVEPNYYEERNWDRDGSIALPEPIEMPLSKGYKFTGVFNENEKKGYKINDEVVIKPIYDDIKQLWEIDNYLFFKVQQNGLYGLCDYQGKLIVPTVYEQIEYINTRTAASFFKVKQNGKWGILSRGGKVTVPIEFGEINNEWTGSLSVLVVKKSWMTGAISTSGKTIIEPKYEAITVAGTGPSSFGFLAWEKNKWGYINQSGVLKIPFEYEMLYYYDNDFILYSTEKAIGVIDTNGTRILEPLYSEIKKPRGGKCFLVTIKTNGKRTTGVFDLKGNQIVAPEYEYFVPFGNEYENHGMYLFSKDKDYNETKLFNTKTLEWVLPSAFKLGVRGGRHVVVMINDPDKPGEYLSGVINETGKLIIPAIYKNLRYIEKEKVATASYNGKYGVVGENNPAVLPFIYDELVYVDYPYDANRDPMKMKGKYFIFVENKRTGLIDITGKITIPAIYDHIEVTRSGIICKTVDKSSVLSPTGKLYSSILHDLTLVHDASGLFQCRDTTLGMDLYGHVGKIPSLPVVRDRWDTYPPDQVPIMEVVEDKKRVYFSSEVDEQPVFVGGNTAMMEFITKNTNYPDVAYELGIQGKSYISFTVENDGSITEVSVQRKFTDCPDCDKEAIKMVKMMPKWTPAKLNGKAVPCKFILPIKFQAQ